METKPLLYGLIGFFMGGLLVSVAATTFDKPGGQNDSRHKAISTNTMSIDARSPSLIGKTGSAYNSAYMANTGTNHTGPER